MSIYDRARHELSKPDKRTEWGRVNRPEHEDAMLYFATEVVRLHEQLEKLADEMKRGAYEQSAPDEAACVEFECGGRILAVLEGGEK